MAKKAASNKHTGNDGNIVRIKAGSSAQKNEKVVTKAAPSIAAETAASAKVETKAEAKAKAKKSRKGGLKVFSAIGGYFKGAWVELRQVRWPTRRATWSFTGAVLVYTAFFVVFVLLLDALFKYLFELILGK